jgi:hypothetical protein
VRAIPPHTRYTMPKESFPALPECFRETHMGEVVLGSRQFRGPHGAHIYEYGDRWVIHRDNVNAESDPLGHLIKDAPEYLASTMLMALVALATGRKDKGRALMAASLAGCFALVSGKVIKMLNGDPAEGEGMVPRFS